MSRHALRPCLKQQQQEWQPQVASSPFPFAGSPMPSAHVHFPPTPRLTSTHFTHSPNTYDRAPIAVARNECALPERNGCTYYAPGTEKPRKRRSHTPGRSAPPPSTMPDSYFHPLASSAAAYQRQQSAASSYPIPVLVADQSSESDESDMVMTPPDATHMPMAPRRGDGSLAFLPHPPSPPERRGRERSRKQPQLNRSDFTHDLELEGCLGGF